MGVLLAWLRMLFPFPLRLAGLTGHGATMSVCMKIIGEITRLTRKRKKSSSKLKRILLIIPILMVQNVLDLVSLIASNAVPDVI